MNVQKEKAENKLAGLVGQRLTPQRLLLLDLLRTGGHLDADELYRRARGKEPRLSISTVYRNLQLFKKLGLVEEHHFNNAHSCYEAKTETEHYHLMCLDCGKIINFVYSPGQKVQENLEVKNRFHITGAKVLLVGYCAECFARRRG